MKKNYLSPLFVAIPLPAEDIITTSEPEDQRGMFVTWDNLDLIFQ